MWPFCRASKAPYNISYKGVDVGRSPPSAAGVFLLLLFFAAQEDVLCSLCCFFTGAHRGWQKPHWWFAVPLLDVAVIG